MTRFLIDEDMPRSLARELRAAGIDAVDVRDLGLRGRADAKVFEYAVRDKRAPITADVEFGNICASPSANLQESWSLAFRTRCFPAT